MKLAIHRVLQEAGMALEVAMSQFNEKTFSPFSNNTLSTPTLKKQTFENYEVIENETLTHCNLQGLTISGSLFSLSQFNRVIFEDCVIYATQLENCHFVECLFINCKFEFSKFDHCSFLGSHFKNCQMQATQIYNGVFKSCFFDKKSLYYFTKRENVLELCHTEDIDFTEIRALKDQIKNAA